MPVDPGRLASRGRRPRSRPARCAARPASRSSRSASSAPRSTSSSSARETREAARAARPAAARAAGSAATPSHDGRSSTRLDAAEVGRRVLPAVRARRSRRACGRRAPATSRSRASSSSSSQPPSVIGASSRRRWFIAASPCRLPMPSEPSEPATSGASRRRRARPRRPASAASPCSTMSPGWNSTPWAISRHCGVRRSRNSRSMLKCLNSSPCASGMMARASGSLLDRQALLVPADRLGLLGQRRAQPRERARPSGSSSGGSWYWSVGMDGTLGHR